MTIININSFLVFAAPGVSANLHITNKDTGQVVFSKAGGNATGLDTRVFPPDEIQKLYGGNFYDWPAGNYEFSLVSFGAADALNISVRFSVVGAEVIGTVVMKVHGPDLWRTISGFIPDMIPSEQYLAAVPPPPPPIYTGLLGTINGIEIFEDQTYTANIYKNGVLTSSGATMGERLWHLFQNGYEIVFGEPIPVVTPPVTPQNPWFTAPNGERLDINPALFANFDATKDTYQQLGASIQNQVFLIMKKAGGPI